MIRCLRVLNALQTHVPAGSNEIPKLTELGLPAETTTDPFNGEPLHVKKTPARLAGLFGRPEPPGRRRKDGGSRHRRRRRWPAAAGREGRRAGEEMSGEVRAPKDSYDEEDHEMDRDRTWWLGGRCF